MIWYGALLIFFAFIFAHFTWIQFHSGCRAYNSFIHIVLTYSLVRGACVCMHRLLFMRNANKNKKVTIGSFKLIQTLGDGKRKWKKKANTKSRTAQTNLSARHFFYRCRQQENGETAPKTNQVQIATIHRVNLGRAGKLIYFHVIFFHIYFSLGASHSLARSHSSQ